MEINVSKSSLVSGGELTGVVFPIGEVVLGELHVNGGHLRGEVQGLLIAGDHGFGAGATLVCCGHLRDIPQSVRI